MGGALLGEQFGTVTVGSGVRLARHVEEHLADFCEVLGRDVVEGNDGVVVGDDGADRNDFATSTACSQQQASSHTQCWQGRSAMSIDYSH